MVMLARLVDKAVNMARTVGSTGERTEAEILKAAIDLIAAHGFEAVTLREIAREAGIQAGSLYRYFPSKGDLLMRVISGHLEDLLEEWERTGRQDGPAGERLRNFIVFHVKYHAARPRKVFIANMELRSLRPDDRAAVVAMRKRYEDILADILRDGVKEGVFSIPDIPVATYGILAMLTGVTAWYQEGGRLSQQQLADCYQQLICHGIEGAGGKGGA